MDIIESRIARQEYEDRVRSLMPVPDYTARLKNDRQHGWVARQAQVLLSTVNNTLNSLSTWLKTYQESSTDVQLKDHLN